MRRAARERVQHEYYAGEGEEEEGTQPANEPAPFKLCGVIEALKTPWPMVRTLIPRSSSDMISPMQNERKRLLELMSKHRMNHYFYAPVPADLATNWRTPFAPDTLKARPPLLCRRR